MAHGCQRYQLLQSTVAWQNPAQVSDSIRGQIMFNYQPYFAGINRGTAAAAITLNESHTILIDTRFVHYGTFDERDIFGEKIGEFSGNEVALGVAYSYAIDSKNLRVGARLNLVSSTPSRLSIYGLDF